MVLFNFLKLKKIITNRWRRHTSCFLFLYHPCHGQPPFPYRSVSPLQTTRKGKRAMDQVFGSCRPHQSLSFWKEAAGEKIPAQPKCAAVDGREFPLHKSNENSGLEWKSQSNQLKKNFIIFLQLQIKCLVGTISPSLGLYVLLEAREVQRKRWIHTLLPFYF